MKINDYILAEDVMSLTSCEYENFLSYLRMLGYSVTAHYCERKWYRGTFKCMALDTDGDLVWEASEPDGNLLSIEDLKRMSRLGLLNEN